MQRISFICGVALLCSVALPARAEHPSNGWIVWASNRNGSMHDIYRMKADGTGVARLTTTGARMPMWSPDGRWIAYETVLGGRTRVMRWDGSEDKEIFNGAPRFWLWDGSRVVSKDSSDTLHLVDPEDGSSSQWLSKSQFSAFGTKDWDPSGLTHDGRWLVTWTDRYRNGYTGDNGTFDAYHSAVMLDLQNKSDIFFIGRGCEPTTPPSGDWVYHVCGGTYCDNHPDIFKMKVADRATRSSYQAEMEHADADWGHEYFPRLSNDGAWVVYGATTGCHDHDTCDYEIFIHRQNAGSSNRERLTTDGANDQWPHLFVGELWGTAQGTIELSTASLSFSASEGGGNPSSQTVTVSNGGAGTLNNVSTSENAAWLSVSRSGSGNNQTLTNSVTVGSLSPGTHNTTVTVSASNAAAAQSYSVSIAVSAAPPSITLSQGNLTFASTAGGSNPASQEISVGNGGGGTLSAASADENADWLAVTVSGSGNSQTLTNTVDLAGLVDGTYSTTVDVSVSGAQNSPRSYDVSLVLSEQLMVNGLQLHAASPTLLSGQSTEVTASVLDQYGAAIAGDIGWSVSAGGVMLPASSGGAVTTHTSTFQSDGSNGTFTVTATSGSASASIDLDVSAVQLPMRINSGSDDSGVSGWMSDDPFVSGGGDWTNPNPVETAGVVDAAPAAVYSSVRHESPHGYDIPLPDGTYILRLHFADAYTDRSMQYVAEGAPILTDFDIASEAGGVNIALVKDFVITVSGGDGLQLDATGVGDVFESGIEILPVPNEAPIVDAGVDASLVVDETLSLTGSVVDDGKPSGELSSAWSKLSGPGEVTFDDAASAVTTATFSVPGLYALQLQASDGALSATDSITVSVDSAAEGSPGSPGGSDGGGDAVADAPVALQGSCSLNALGSGSPWLLVGLLAFAVRRRRQR